MKRIAIILLLLCAFFRNAEAQTVHTNNIHLSYDYTSYDTTPYQFIGAYSSLHYVSMYPELMVYTYSRSRSGASWDFDFQNGLPLTFAIWRSWQDHTGTWENIDITLASDNGGYTTTNEAFQAGTNLDACPPIFWDGTQNVNYSSDLSYRPYRWFPGGIPGSEPAATNRDIASIQLMQALRGVTTSGLLGPMMAAGWLGDLSADTPKLGFYSGGHPYPAGHLFMHKALLHEMNEETNVGSIVVNWNDASVATNHATVTGNSISGNSFSGTLKWLRMAPPIDIPDGTHTNNCWPAFQVDPTLLSLYNWKVGGTNFPATATVTTKLNGEVWFTCSGAQFNSGINVWTNFNTALGRQRMKLLDDKRDQQGLDHVTLLETHSAGDTGLNGWQDRINVGSQLFTDWEAGKKGIALYNDATTHQMITNSWQFDYQMHADAQPVAYSLTIDIVVPPPPPTHLRLRAR